MSCRSIAKGAPVNARKAVARGCAGARAPRRRPRGGGGARISSARRVRARTCGLDPMAKLAKVPAVGPVPPGRREMASIVVAWLDARLAADTKSLPSLCRRGANSVPKRPTNDTRGRRSGAGRVLRGRLDLPSARTRPEAATNAARRVTSHRRKPTRHRAPDRQSSASRQEPRVFFRISAMHGMHETNGPRV